MEAAALPLKAPAAHEPVLTAQTGLVIAVMGLTGIGRPIARVCHRPERVCAVLAVSPEQCITPEMAARVICAEGLCDIIYVNQVDDAELSPPWAETFAKASNVPVVIGSLQSRRWRRLA